ncbi:hypothetical protein GGR56DRAFT_127307 [Xylariaceae sp. FL0804]|nr:hypothetical protein GGR56DRAFT_127307 [Xylariaceae sp. FL0804]
MLSKFPCPRCHGRFDSEADRSSHLRAVELCEVQDRSTPEVITADQLSRLSFKGSKASEADKWEQMYRIIFPEDPAVPSPYVDGPCGRCVSGAESRLLEESFRELGSSFCRELAALPGLDARGGDLAARLAGILQRAAVDILARFRAARGAPSPRGAPRPGARLDGGPAAAATPRGADTAYRAPAPLDAWFSQFSTSAEENRALVDHMPLAAGNDAHDAAGAQESWGYEGLFDFQLG